MGQIRVPESSKGGTAKGSKQSEFYGTGLKGRQVRTAIAREAAQKAEEKYAEMVAERAAGKQTHSPAYSGDREH